MSLAAFSPCTKVGNKIVSHIGNLLLIVVIISLTAAPVLAVIIPTLLGIELSKVIKGHKKEKEIMVRLNGNRN